MATRIDNRFRAPSSE